MRVLVWEPHLDAWLLLGALLAAYAYALRAWRPERLSGTRAATRGQVACFLAGVATLWIASDWPVHTLAEERLYSVHMLQHMLYMFVAPPLLILGTPGWLLRRLLSPAPVFAVVSRITRPLPALVIVNTYIAVSHTPFFVNASVRSPLFHFTAHAVLIAASLVLWWPVLSPLPELPHLSYPGRMAYLFAHSVIPTVPASFLTFTHSPLYASYAELPRLWPWLDAVQDQQIAGLLMKIGGGLLLWSVIAALFFRWYHEEESGGPDLLYWRDLQLDIERSNSSS